MKTYALIGPSGTGKSHHALIVAKEKGIQYVIDDGLLIKENRILAGISAKRENTRISSIKRALFLDNEHSLEVKTVLNIHDPQSILVLGTSDRMANAIAKALGLPDIIERIYINDVVSEIEIKRALTSRQEEGKHVIPVPTFEIKKDFSGYFLHPLQIFRRKGTGREVFTEKSVVRPTFSYLGKYIISDTVLQTIAEHETMSIKGVNRILHLKMENFNNGMVIDMDLVLMYGYDLRRILNAVQENVKSQLEKFTSLNVLAVNITAKSIYIPEKFPGRKLN